MPEVILDKLGELEIPKENPWSVDVLGRKKCADTLTTLIRTLQQPYVISVVSPWGMGKTEFLRMWAQDLRNQKQPCIYFNAWETDFAEDPMVAFIGEIDEYTELEFGAEGEEETEERKQFKKIREKAGFFFRKASPHILKAVIKGLTRGAVDVDALKDVLGERNEEALGACLADIGADIVKDYKKEKQSIAAFKKSLQEFAQGLAESGYQMPLVIFIDELDRCRPAYALELLEDVKHLFSVPNIVFILAIDKEQLGGSIKTILGSGLDADGYLRRFVDLEYILEQPNTEMFAKFLFKKFNLELVFREKAKESFPHVMDRFIDKFVIYSRMLNFSLRKQAQCFSRLTICLCILNKIDEKYILLLLLCIVRFSNDSLYRKILSKNIEAKEVIDLFFSIHKSEFSQDELWLYEDALEMHLKEKNSIKKLYNEHLKIYESRETLDHFVQERSGHFIHYHNNAMNYYRSFQGDALQYFINIIEMTNKISLPSST